MHKVLSLVIFLFFGITAISQSIKNYKLFGYKQERTGGASMNYEDGSTAINVTTDYLLYIDSKNNQLPLIKSVFINGHVASFKIVPIEKIPTFNTLKNEQKNSKLISQNKAWQIMIDVLELPKTKPTFFTLLQKNELVLVLKNNQKLVQKKLTSVTSKIYE